MSEAGRGESASVSRLPSGSSFSPAAKIYVAGHRGMVGSSLVRRLKKGGYGNLVLRTSSELDLRCRKEVDAFFAEQSPEHVFLAAARVGGIMANSTCPADFIRDNLQIQTNVIDAAWRHGVKRLLFLGSSCIYPKHAPQPMKEEYLLTGPLEPTNEWYAIAKIAGIKLCQAYRKQYGFNAIALMPTNLYGPNDHFNLETSHVLPALIRKFHLAKLTMAGDMEAIAADEARRGRIPEDILHHLGVERVRDSGPGFIHTRSCPKVILWGTGSPRREFLHVDDLAEACLFLMVADAECETKGETPSPAFRPISSVPRLFNVGVGEDMPIRDLAGMVRDIIGFDGEVIWDSSRPDGTPRKLLDVSRISSLGWKAGIDIRDGIKSVYAAYMAGR